MGLQIALSEEVATQLDRWPAKSRKLFDELMEDAGSDLQRELIQRAIAAGHTPSEVHAFADELRGMDDAEAFSACTLEEDTPLGYSVPQLLRAEADPLYAFELKGGEISPSEEDGVIAPLPTPPAGLHDGPVAQGLDPLALARARRERTFDSAGVRRPAADVGDGFGHGPPVISAPPGPPSSAPSNDPMPGGGGGGNVLDDLANEATRGMGISWREYEVDVPGGLTLEQAVERAGAGLADGVPVLVGIGPGEGKTRRIVLALQLSVSGKSRAWELYDPLSGELVWANEKDFLNRTELPFSNKANRRVTRVALPSSHRYA